jgi:hypothetical protein
MSETATPSIQKAGSVNVRELKLISANNLIVDLNEFLVELNIYEDIFSSHLYGDILLSDSRNLIDTLPIIGEENLVVEFFTPSFEEQSQIIKKTFRVFKLSGRQIVRDNNTQLFVLHFASIELFYDMLLPLYRSFTGKITDIVQDLYFDYVATQRNADISTDSKTIKVGDKVTPLVITNDTSNKVKFVAPGWTPFKCINWLASKSIPESGTTKNFLFFETNKAFYFGSLEYIFKNAIESKNIVGTYTYSPNNSKEKTGRDFLKEYFTVSDMEMVDTTDHVKNYTNGYLANRLITLDVYNKVYKRIDYDYVEDYKNNYHTSGKGQEAIPVFTLDSPRNFSSSVSFYPVNPKLFDNFPGNVSEKMEEIYGNRKSSLLGLTNIKLNITVPGRSDIEVGNLIYFKFPSLGPTSEEDKNKEKVDKNYSGYYLITAIHHRVTISEHVMVMEIVKDSLKIEE